jgi:AcrR family transcriptional regulator
MARHAARAQPINTALPKGTKSTQRERLLNGMVAAANRDGYAGANVSAVIEQAGVSRPTFYDYFADRDECFLAAITDCHERIAGHVRLAVAGEPPEQALAAMVRAVVAFASEQPGRAHFLMSEAMAGGPRALDTRDEGIKEIEGIVGDARRRTSPGAETADIPAGVLLGGIYRLLSSKLRRGEPSVARLADELLPWIARYERPAREHRWRTLKPSPPPPPSPFLPDPQPPPAQLGPGRPGISPEQVAANHRERILYAAGELADEKGYGATTIADVTKRAGIDGRAFYALFLDKQDAFMTAHELGLQQVLDVTASAFFAGASWPERVWEAGRALTQFLERNPLITHVGFVEAPAVGPGAAQRVQDSHAAFAIFLQEGYLHVTDGPAPTRAAVEAIITTIFELVYHQARASAKPKLSGLVGHVTFLCLAPFLGAREANEFITKKLPEKASRRGLARRAPQASRPKPQR